MYVFKSEQKVISCLDACIVYALKAALKVMSDVCIVHVFKPTSNVMPGCMYCVCV